MKSFIEIVDTSFGSVAINPGTGPIEGANLENAQSNIVHLIQDAGIDPDQVTIEHIAEYDPGDGRFFFSLSREGYTCEVEMPGLPLEQVRYIDSETQNIWHYPRLYYNGSSWVWKFAMEFLGQDLTGQGESEDAP